MPRTQLSPLEEVLFYSWGKANGIEDLDDPKSPIDFRRVYVETKGKVEPGGMLGKLAQEIKDTAAAQQSMTNKKSSRK